MATARASRVWTLIGAASKGGFIAVLAAFVVAGIYQYAADVHWYDGAIWIYIIVIVASPILFALGGGVALMVRAIRAPAGEPAREIDAPPTVVEAVPARRIVKTPAGWLVAGGLAGYEAARSTRFLGLPAIPAGPVLGELLLPPLWILGGVLVAKRSVHATRSVRATVGALIVAGAAFAAMELVLVVLGVGPFQFDLRGMLLLSAIVGLVAYKRLLATTERDRRTADFGSARSASRAMAVWMVGGALAGFIVSGVALIVLARFYSGLTILVLIPICMCAGAAAARRAARSTGHTRAVLAGIIAAGAVPAIADLVIVVTGAPRGPQNPPAVVVVALIAGWITHNGLAPDARAGAPRT